MKILLVYENVPEDTDVYILDVSPEDWSWIKLTHGNFVNAVIESPEAEQACVRLSTWLEDKPKANLAAPILLRCENFDYFLHTGFLL